MFEVIIYAGAIMVLFMFVIMMLDPASADEAQRPGLLHWLPALLFAGIILASLVIAACCSARRCRSRSHRAERQGVCRDPVPELRRRHRDHLHAAAVCRGRGSVSGQEAQAHDRVRSPMS